MSTSPLVHVRTEDAHVVSLHHTPAAGGSARLPVLCLHGLGANRHNFELFGSAHALPRVLARQGHDVYSVELRGIGMSRMPGHRVAHGVDEYLRYDLTAAVDYVLRAHGVPKLHWIGHSLGSILGYLYGSRHPHQLQSLTAAAGPLPSAVPILGPVKGLVLPLRHLIRGPVALGRMPSRSGARLMRLAPRLTRMAYHKLLFNGPNMPNELLVQVAGQCLEDIPMSLLRRLAEWALKDGPEAGPNAGEVERGLASLHVPTLMLAATIDPLCPPAAAEAALEWMPPGYGRLKVISKSHGYEADFGHGDLLVSPLAQRVVYPEISGFVAAQDDHYWRLAETA